MKITSEDIAELSEIIKEVDQFRPLVTMILDTLKSFGPELKQIPESIVLWGIDLKIAMIKRIEDAGFSREEAILLVIDFRLALQEAILRASTAYNK
ncbi:MAG: hypothetical protein ABIL06_13060 [Pseudomonadota bacterium]|uniref:Uncharacterized protein n=1 Tax=viral metagenome TaxID=1070528 RepID=A0A6H1ZHT9_9ZZZZ